MMDALGFRRIWDASGMSRADRARDVLKSMADLQVDGTIFAKSCQLLLPTPFHSLPFDNAPCDSESMQED